MRFASMPLQDLCDFPKISAGVTKDFIRSNPGTIPVYGSSKDGAPIGFIGNIKKIRYFENCLGWNRNGSVGYVFLHNHKFTTTDDHRPLCIKKEFIDKLDVEFLRFSVQEALFSNGFAWGNKAGVEKLKLLYIEVPVTESGEFDLEAQYTIAMRHKKLFTLKSKADEFLERVKNTKITLDIPQGTVFKHIDLISLFVPVKGDSKYTQKYFKNHEGSYPVYSGQTKAEGLIATINSYDFDTETKKWLTWTTDGVYAGSVFSRTGKFSMTTHCGLLKPLKALPEDISIEYIQYILDSILPNYAVGDQNRRVTKEIISTVSIPIPITPTGEYDITLQNKIAEQYSFIKNKKSEIIESLRQIRDIQVRLGENV